MPVTSSSAPGPWKIAIVGFGKIAQDQHVQAISDNPDFQLAAIISRSAKKGAVPVFTSLENALATGISLDAISVCTPPSVRLDICELATSNGLAIMLEKPPAATVAEAHALADMASRRGVPIFASWHSRFAPCVADARSWCSGKDAVRGEILWHEDPAKWHPGQSWLWQAGGFGVFDPGINALSILTAIRPGAWEVSDVILELPENAETPSAASFRLHRGLDAVGVSFRFNAGNTENWSILLTAADGDTLHLSDGGTALSIKTGSVVRKKEAEYLAVYRRFADLIRKGQSEMDLTPLVLVEDAFHKADFVDVGAVLL